MKDIIALYLLSKESPEAYIRYRVAIKLYARNLIKVLWQS